MNEPRLQGARRAKPFSPVLDHILNGGPGITFDVRKVAHSARGTSLFSSEFLNNVIMFKYPAASMPMAAGGNGKETGAAVPREPVQTGIFMPYDRTRPEEGGTAIYVRQRNFDDLLRLHVGLTDDRSRLTRDLSIIQVIEKVPTLDPFLMRLVFRESRIEVDHAVFAMPSGEEEAIRATIASRIAPILARALGEDTRRASAALAQLVEVLSDPDGVKAVPLVRAFGIPAESAGSVLTGWKGLTYYQRSFEQAAPLLSRAVGWLKSPKAVPRDVRRRSFEADQFAMAASGLAIGLASMIHRTTDVFAKYEYAFAAMLNESDASPFIEFLNGVERSFWVLGYQTASLQTMATWFATQMADATDGHLTTDAMTTMVRRFRHALDSQMEVARHAG